MQNIVDIKNRIKSVKDTAQITKAMELISVAKMRKANVKFANNIAYFNKVRATIKDILLHSNGDNTHPYLGKRDGKRRAFVVIASNKGLAGDYNQRVLKLAHKEITSLDNKYVFTIGHMAREYFVKQGITPDIEFLHCAENPTLDDARGITADLIALYDNNLIDEIDIVFTEAKSALVSKPRIIPLLPILVEDFIDVEIESNYSSILDFEPSPISVLETLVPQYILGIVYSCLIQAVACEHSERMRTMNTATKNANELIEKLGLEQNRARQESITTEIAEIASTSILFNKDSVL